MKNVQDVYRLSPMQREMLFYSLYAPDGGANIEQVHFTLHGPLDASALERAWQKLVERHPVLRTAFFWEGMPEPLQAVRTKVDMRLEQLDWTGLSEDEQAARIERYLQQIQQEGFKLSAAPLMRLTLVALSPGLHRFVWSYHHILLDGWSVPLCLREVSLLYEACAEGRTIDLGRPCPYRDYIAWLGKQDVEAAKAYWSRTLADLSLPSPLPIDRGADLPHTAPVQYAARECRLSASVTSRIQAATRQHRVTLSTLLQGAWAILLARYRDERDVLFGATVSGRPAELPDVDGMVGLFINTLPTRVRVDPEAEVVPWLQALQVDQLAARRYDILPVSEIRTLAGFRGKSLFDSILVVENLPDRDMLGGRRGSVRIGGIYFALSRTGLPLTVVAQPAAELSLQIAYDASRFDGASIERILGHLTTLLEELEGGVGRRIRDVPMLTARERDALVQWNATTSAYPLDTCIHELFEAQAARTPDAVAVVFEEQQLTYAEFDARANRLAAELARRGVGKRSFVPIRMDRCIELPIAMLGVLKAGAAFVPLDVHWPEDRTRQILAQLPGEVILVDLTVAPMENLGRSVLVVDAKAPAGPTSVAGQRVDPDAPIYVIFTSGSTGVPKGVVVPHRGITNRFLWMNAFFGAEAARAVLQTTYHVYDSAVWQLFWPLINGGTTVMPIPGREADAAYLTALIARHGVTMTDLVPSVFATILPQMLSDASSRDKLRSLRSLVVGGEEITAGAAHAFLERFPDVRLVNLYGPTEASIGCICYTITGQEPGRIPIGKPIANTQVVVLDEERRLVPIGVPGELYLAGKCLGIGYLGDEEKTKAAFVDNPFAEIASAKLYKTGDRVRWLPDGTLEFLGRIDHQVKIRGYRIELGEIETALSSHPSVRACAVAVREDAPGDKRLVAYVVPSEGECKLSELRKHLRATLPEHMVPSAFVLLAALPLTTNGKIDRKALPAPEDTRDDAGNSYIAPRTPTEHALAAAWEELLGVHAVGVTDDFFALGGHSLLAVRLMSVVKARLGWSPPMASLFQHPTVGTLAALMDGAMARRASCAEVLPVHRAAGEPAYADLSGTERRLWFLHRLEPKALSYQVPHAFRLSGALDEAALRRSLKALAERHELFRTTYPEMDGVPVRVVSPEARIPVRLEDVSSLPAAEREAAVRARVATEVATAFDLECGPLTRVLVVRVEQDSHVVIMHQHHIQTDEWSAGVLLREWSTLYEAARRGQEAVLPALAYQYADFARAEQQALAGEGFAASRAYWKAQLSGLPRLDLSIVRPSTGAGPGPEGHVSFRLPAETSSELRAIARANGCTLFMAWYAAFTALLSRYSQQTDFGLGAMVANREVSGTEGLLGFFTNTVVLRADLSGNPSFKELLRRARRISVEAYQHQSLPFDVVVQDQGVARRAGGNPLYDLSFFEVTAPAGGASAGWSPLSGALPEGLTSAKDALGLAVHHTSDGAEVHLSYDTSRIEGAAVERLVGHLQTLLLDAVSHPEKPLSELALLTEAEQTQLAAWNDTAAGHPSDKCIHDLFQAQAEKTPDAVAVQYDDAWLSYAELNAQSNRLAHHLRRLGVGPEVLVALCVERSLYMVVGLLGILKAGGAYVPLDPSYPPARLSFMLADARAPVLLTQAHIEDRLSAHEAKVVRLDADASQWAEQPNTPTETGVRPDNLAYVIYTSGSTGLPKGVALQHRGSVAFLRWTQRAFSDNELLAVVASTSLSFDVSFFELFGPLIRGGRIRVLRDVMALQSANLENARWMLVTVPSAVRALVQEGILPRQIHWLNLAGERLDQATVELVVERSPHVERIRDLYGPTEDTTYSTCAVRVAGGKPTIGRPIENTCARVLDGGLQPLPVGVTGELYLSGAGLARGYLARPGLTADRFVPDPFTMVPGARMYRTGDLARWSADGQLEFLGRIDHQVKLRGYRIELGEIESALSSHASVRACVVVAREDAPGETRLVAYVVPAESNCHSSALREHLRATLPDYMVPSAFVLFAAFPMTENGKIDRKALRALEGAREVAGASYAAPRTEAERTLARVWSEVLRFPEVGIHDNFFSMGGDSIRAIQVVGRMQRAGLHVTVRELFEHQTVAMLSQVARRSSALFTEQGEVMGAVPLTPIQHWFLDAEPEDAHDFNQAMMCSVSPSLSPEAIATALKAIVQQHDALRLRYRYTESGWVQEHARESTLSLERVDLSSVGVSERAGAIYEATAALRSRFSLEMGPLARAAWLDLGEAGARLLLVIHHLVVDGVSWRILHEDLERACAQVLASQTPSLGAKTTSFRQWSERLCGWVADGGLTEELSYWQAQCQRLVTSIPIDRNAPLGTTGESRTLQVELSESETTALLREVGRAYRTEINDVLLAALAETLGAFCDAQTICVTLEGHGREAIVGDVDVSRTVGWFTSVFPVWLDVPSGNDTGTLLKSVKEQLRSIPHRGLGYGWLRYAHPDASVRASLSVDAPVLFNYLGQFDMEAQGSGSLLLAMESTGTAMSPRMALHEVFSINGGVWQGRLRFRWTYSPGLHEASTVERLAQRFMESLRRVIAHCTSPSIFGVA